jgi:ribosomal protein S18 acetylase RimI-like enzyme
MALSTSISRLAAYYARHGFKGTIRRAALSVKRAVLANCMVVFYCDLASQTMAPGSLPTSLKVERLRNYSDLSPQDLHEITSFWNPRLAHRRVKERFERGASLWLIRSAGSLAGYSWTLRGSAIAAYYFPMALDDVQLFDFYVFPRFRGRAILWFLVTDILRSLRDEGATRVFGDVAEWNQASLSFYRTVPFQRLGLARSFTIFGHTFISWAESEPVAQTGKQTSIPVTGTGSSISDLRT